MRFELSRDARARSAQDVRCALNHSKNGSEWTSDVLHYAQSTIQLGRTRVRKTHEKTIEKRFENNATEPSEKLRENVENSCKKLMRNSQKVSRRLVYFSFNSVWLSPHTMYVRACPNASERIQMHPNASERIRMHPNRSEQVRASPKTSKNLRKPRKNLRKHRKTSRKLRTFSRNLRNYFRHQYLRAYLVMCRKSIYGMYRRARQRRRRKTIWEFR